MEVASKLLIVLLLGLLPLLPLLKSTCACCV